MNCLTLASFFLSWRLSFYQTCFHVVWRRIHGWIHWRVLTLLTALFAAAAVKRMDSSFIRLIMSLFIRETLIRWPKCCSSVCMLNVERSVASVVIWRSSFQDHRSRHSRQGLENDASKRKEVIELLKVEQKTSERLIEREHVSSDVLSSKNAA